MVQNKVASLKDWYWSWFPYLYGFIAGLGLALYSFSGYDQQMEPAVKFLAVACVLASAFQTRNTFDQDMLFEQNWKNVKTLFWNLLKFSVVFMTMFLVTAVIKLAIEIGPEIWQLYSQKYF